MFYTYRQNNSGGSFIMNDEVCQYVIIEANSDSEANSLAESHGIYFDGCDDGQDCSCCGDRWSRTWGDCTEQPTIYDKPLEEASKDKYTASFTPKGEPLAYIYYLNGEKETFIKE